MTDPFQRYVPRGRSLSSISAAAMARANAQLNARVAASVN